MTRLEDWLREQREAAKGKTEARARGGAHLASVRSEAHAEAFGAVLQRLKDLGPLLGLDEVREKLLGEEAVDRVAEEDAIEELYGHWEDIPSRENKEARQRQRYAQLAKKRGVQESWKAGARRDIERFLALLDTFNPPVEDGGDRIGAGPQGVPRLLRFPSSDLNRASADSVTASTQQGGSGG